MKIVLRPNPDFFDLEGWKAYLEELRSDPEDTVGRESGIKIAEQMVRLLSEDDLGAAPDAG